MITRPAKPVFVQKISHRAKEATISSYRTEDQLIVIKQISSANIGPENTVNGKSPMAISWAPSAVKESRYGVVHKCSRLGDMTHSKFLVQQNRKPLRGSFAQGCNNKINSLDEFLSNNKMHTSFLLEDLGAEKGEEDKTNLFKEFSLTINKSQSLFPNPQSYTPLDPKYSSFCNSQNLQEFTLQKDFRAEEKSSTSSKSSIMRYEQAQSLYRSIAYQSESYDSSKSGFLINSSEGKPIFDKIERYLTKARKSLSDPFFELKTTLVVEDEVFDTYFWFKLQEDNIVYSWQCKKQYPNVGYFDRKFEFFNHFRIEVFFNDIKVSNKYSVEPFLHKNNCEAEAFSFEMDSTLPLEDLSKTKTIESDSRINSFIEEHQGSWNWEEIHP